MEKIKKDKKINQKFLVSEKDQTNPTIKQLMNKVIQTLEKLDFDFNSKVLIAVSGGVDSITLLDIMANLTLKYNNLRLGIAHFNHKLRGKSSDEDEKFVRNLSNKYNIQFFSSSGNVSEYSELKGVSIEQAARTLRYKFLERASKKFDADYVFTAHTIDDNVETFFINLFRGSGLAGLSGIPKKRLLVKRILLLRPLINLRKKDLINYAKIRKLNWREDESNQFLNYSRNKIRLELIPYIEEKFNPSIVNVIQRTQELIDGAENLVNQTIQKAIVGLVAFKSKGRFSIKLNLFKIYDDFVKGEIIQRLINNNFNISNLSMNTIDRIIQLEDKPVGSICEINKNYYVLKDRNLLIFLKKQPDEFINEIINKEGEFKTGNKKLILKKVRKNQVKFVNNKNIEYLDWDLIPSILYVRNWQEGDKFQPLGMTGAVKLSDYFINNKISLADKNDVLILTSKSEIIWVCGHQISDKFKITENTTKFLKVELNENTENYEHND